MPIKQKRNMEAGWVVSESIMLELDIILSVINGYIDPGSFEDIDDLFNKIPPNLLKELRQLLPGKRKLVLSLSKISLLSGNLFETDYKKASFSARKMGLVDFMNAQAEQVKGFPILPDKKLEPFKVLIDLLVKTEHYSEKQMGFKSQESYIKESWNYSRKIIKGGELEYDFWHCLDRFYYEVYLPWRQENISVIEQQQKNTVQALGKSKSNDSYPDIEVLKKIHPIFHRPNLVKGLSALKVKIHFITTPFRYFDLAHWEPGYGLFTVSETAWKDKNWVDRIDEIAKITKAISDPSRLSILRMIRQSGKYSTEIAAFMNVSRPTVSEHCKILRNAGLIETYQEGRKNYHQLRPRNVRKLFSALEGFLDLPEDEN